jgi:hypothetical protein
MSEHHLKIPPMEPPLSTKEAYYAIEFLKNNLIAFMAGHMTVRSDDGKTLHPYHYDLLTACGARMVDFIRGTE